MGRLSKSDRNRLVADVRDSLNNDLSFDLYFSIDSYHEDGWNEDDGSTNVDVNIEVYTDRADEILGPLEDIWDCDVEDVIAEVASRWGGDCWWTNGWYDGWTIRLSIEDNP